MRNLGTYELEEDAARACDKVARILGRSDLKFPNSDALEIHGPRSEGADKAVAAAVEDARTFVAAGGHNHTSIYIGVSKHKRRPKNPWQSLIRVSPKTVRDMELVLERARLRMYAHTHPRTRACTLIYTHTRTHTH